MKKVVVKERCNYTIISYILLFFTFSLLGFLWEVLFHFIETGDLVNKGILLGPVLPIYGSGGLIAIILLKKYHKRPILTFFLMMLIASIIEYGTSFYIEVTKGIRFWDYSGYFLNLNGRICLEGAIVFGLAGNLAIYILGPKLNEFYQKIPKKIAIILCAILITVFTIDLVHSHYYPNMGKGITNYEYKNQK